MKNKIPSEGLRLGRDSGSILCDTLKKVAFSDSLGGGELAPAAGIRASAPTSTPTTAACSTPTVSSMPSPGDRDTTREDAPD